MSKNIKIRDIVWIPVSYAEHGQDEDYWVIVEGEISRIANGYCSIKSSSLMPMVSKVFETLSEAKEYINNYLVDTYNHKWKDSYLKEVLNNVHVKSMEK